MALTVLVVLIACFSSNNALASDPISFNSTTTPTANWSSIASSADGTHLIATVNSFTSGKIWVSTDSGSSWTPITTTDVFWTSSTISSDGTRMAAGDSNGNVVVSSNSGVTWSQVQSPSGAQINSITLSGNGLRLFTTDQNGNIFYSTNLGSTWIDSNAPNAMWASLASSYDGQHVVAVASGGDIYTSSDFGVTWIAGTNANINWSSVASSVDGSHLVAVTNGASGPTPSGIYLSNDYGVTWTRSNASSLGWSSVAISNDGVHLAATTQNAGPNSGTIYTSSDSGTTWSQASSPNGNWTAITTSSDGLHLFAALSQGSIYTASISTPARSIQVPDPIQQSKITSMAPTAATAGESSTVVVTGSFIEKISNIAINNTALPVGNWTQTPTSVTFTVPAKSTGSYQIQLYNGSAPVLAAQNFSVSSPSLDPLASRFTQKVTIKQIYIRCMKGTHMRIAFGISPMCPAGYQSK